MAEFSRCQPTTGFASLADKQVGPPALQLADPDNRNTNTVFPDR